MSVGSARESGAERLESEAMAAADLPAGVLKRVDADFAMALAAAVLGSSGLVGARELGLSKSKRAADLLQHAKFLGRLACSNSTQVPEPVQAVLPLLLLETLDALPLS